MNSVHLCEIVQICHYEYNSQEIAKIIILSEHASATVRNITVKVGNSNVSRIISNQKLFETVSLKWKGNCTRKCKTPPWSDKFIKM